MRKGKRRVRRGGRSNYGQKPVDYVRINKLQSELEKAEAFENKLHDAVGQCEYVYFTAATLKLMTAKERAAAKLMKATKRRFEKAAIKAMNNANRIDKKLSAAYGD